MMYNNKKKKNKKKKKNELVQIQTTAIAVVHK